MELSGGIKIHLLVHDTVRIKTKDVVMYWDPFKLPDQAYEPANIVVISHEHFDHCSPNDLKKVITPETVIIASNQCRPIIEKLHARKIHYLKPGEVIVIKDVQFEAVPAYNVNKFRAPGQPFHPKEDKKNGYVITLNGKRIYHAGDTDVIPEMNTVKDIALAFLPVSGIYVMTAEEAAEAAKIIQPKIAVPYHYGCIVGTRKDAERFKELAKDADVDILI